MRLGRLARTQIGRLGIAMLILGLLHVPLPQPDFHNVRHHDTPGEVCEHHDHLLRWHPDAPLAQDVALFHWHWFVPTTDPSDMGEPGQGPAIHAHIAGWDAPTLDAMPPVINEGPGRYLDVPTSKLPLTVDLALIGLGLDSFPERAGPRSGRTPGALRAPHVSMNCLLQRWSC